MSHLFHRFRAVLTWLDRQGAALRGAVLFYTRLPLPPSWSVRLDRVAYFAPWVGAFLGGILALVDGVLGWAAVPNLLRSGLVIAAWVGLTGGLHLDGAMDTADGLAVLQPERRLAVMRDSLTGAFGVMAAVLILGLKTLALAELVHFRGWALILAAIWGRFGQLGAIALYPYLHPEGKGAFHQKTLKLPGDLIWGSVPLVGVAIAALKFSPIAPWSFLGLSLWGLLVSFGVGWWLKQQLGGHTGDTYGAIVEWTEVCFLVGWVTLAAAPFLGGPRLDG
jgi:adenosylcobinamide-GDP ribazoletransferase